MRAQNMSHVHGKQVLEYARRSLSPYVYLCGIDEEKSVANLGLQVQETIIDHGEKGSALKFIQLNDLASIQWDQKGRDINFDGPSRREFVKSARSRYSTIINKSQKILLPSIYANLVRIPEVNLTMNPLRRILIYIHSQGRITLGDLGKKYLVNDRGQRYLVLLEDLSFIKRENGYYVSGEKMNNLQADEILPPDLYEMILAEVIQKRSKYLQEVLHWTMMVPFLRWSNTYYLKAYQAGHIILQERDDFIFNYKRFYSMGNNLVTALSQIQKIVDVKVLSKERNRLYFGDQTILESYSAVANKERILEPIHMGIS